MAKPSKVKIDVTKLLKEHFFKGQKGTYCTLVLWENKDGPDQYGNTHSVKQEIAKEARDAGAQEPYVGSATIVTDSAGRREQPKAQQRGSGSGGRYQQPQRTDDSGEGEIPF